MSKTWKQFERVVAAFFRTVRNPLSGSNGKHTRSDTLHKELYIECKYSAKSSLVTLFDDTDCKAAEEGKLPVVCTKKKGQSGFLVTIHSDDIKNVLEILNETDDSEVEELQQV